MRPLMPTSADECLSYIRHLKQCGRTDSEIASLLRSSDYLSVAIDKALWAAKTEGLIAEPKFLNSETNWGAK